MAQALHPYGLTRLISSLEPKAEQTAQILAEVLGIPYTTAPDLHEQLRHTVPWYDSPVEHETALLRLFAERDAVVFGEESAQAALTRFTQAIQIQQTQYPDDILGIVTHGTVSALYLEARTGIDAVEYWRAQGLPMFVVLQKNPEASSLPYRVSAMVRNFTEE
jgi:broad specificity phosphatase PhoE